MNVVELADELGVTTATAVDLCARAGIPGVDRGTELTPEQVAAARSVAAQPSTPLPPPPGAAPSGYPPPPGPVAPPPPAAGPPGYQPPPGYGAPTPPGYGAPAYPTPGYGTPGYGAPGYGPPPTPGYLGGPPKKKSSGRKILLTVCLVIGIPLFLLIMIGVFLGEETSERSSPDIEGVTDLDGGRRPITDRVQVGDCFDEPPSGQFIIELDTIPCTSAHDVEVYAKVEHPAPAGDLAPSIEDLHATAVDLCSPSYETFLGAPVGSPDYDMFVLFPQELAWEIGDERTIVCGIYSLAGPTTGSLEGAGG